MVSVCRECGARIIWLKMDSGKNMPVDEKPSGRGLIAMRDHTHGRAWQPDDDPSLVRWASHFATCPNAPVFRRAAQVERNRSGNDGT